MKVIFLDFDGVITTLKSKYKLDLKALSLLKEIINATDAKIVISSSWRRHTLEDTIKELQDTSDVRMNGIEFPFIDRIIGITDRIFGFALTDKEKHISLLRGVEIREWLKEHPEVTNYVILDDDSDMLLEQANHFVKTDTYEGLTNENVEQAINILQDETTD